MPLPAATSRPRLLEWHLPLACVLVILLSILYTYHTHHQALQNCSEGGQQLLQELASMQIMGIILASTAAAALKRMTHAKEGVPTLVRGSASAQLLQHPMLPLAAARRRQLLLPLV